MDGAWTGGGSPCGFSVPPERLERLAQVAREARAQAGNARRAAHLATLIEAFERTRGDALIASAGGGQSCTSEGE